MPKLADPTSEKLPGVVERIEQGDSSAEAELIELYARGVRLMLIKRTGDPHLAKDLCQDTFIVILRKLRAQELRQHDSLAAFISQTAVNICIQHFRKEKRYVYTPDGIIDLNLAHIDQHDKNIDYQTARVHLESVLDQLAVSRDREILKRFYLSDDDKDVICRELGLSSIHFDRVLYRAKQRMRELIDQQEGLKALLFGGLLDA